MGLNLFVYHILGKLLNSFNLICLIIKINNKKFSDNFIMGGLTELNQENINIRKLHIQEGLMMHTCNDYGKSLEVINTG